MAESRNNLDRNSNDQIGQRVLKKEKETETIAQKRHLPLNSLLMRFMIGMRAFWPMRPAIRSSLWCRLSATCFAMITRRSWVSRHFSHSQSRNSQYRLWPFTAIIRL